MRFRAAVAALCAASLVLSACGGDDDGDDVAAEADDTVEQTTPDTEDEATDDTEPATDDTEPADDGEGESGDDGDRGDPSGDIEDLGDAMDLLNSDCLEFALAYGSIFMAGLGLTGDDAALEDAMADLEELNASVPDEIADEFEVLAEAYAGYWEEIAGLSLMELGDVPNPEDEDEVREAQEAIDAYLEEECATG